MRPILVATDLSDASRPSLEAAAQLARDLQAPIVLVHAIEPPHVYADLGGSVQHRQLQKMRQLDETEEVRQLTQEWAERLRADGTEVETVVAMEEPDQLIARTAKEHSAPLIVVATHGRSGVGRLLMGSVAQKVIRQSDRPVLVVPSRKP